MNKELDIEKIAEIAKKQFPIRLDIEIFHEQEIVLRSNIETKYLRIHKDPVREYIELCFFESWNKEKYLYQDIEHATNFRPETLKDVKTLINTYQ